MTAQPDSLIQDASTWRANIDASSGVGAVGTVMNPLLFLPLKNSLAMEHGVGSVTFARAIASASPFLTSYIDFDGLVKYAALDQPRFEKNGLLMEGESTNELTFNSEIFNSVWAKSNVTAADNNAAAPDGSTTAALLNATVNGGYLREGFTISADTLSRTISLFFKAGTALSSFIDFRYGTWGSPDKIARVNITWATGDIFLSSGTPDNWGYEWLADGWLRLDLSFANVNYTNLEFTISPASNLTGTCYVWGAQLEELPFASSYIPTTANPVTRAADSCLVTALENLTLQAHSGTIIMDVSLLGLNTTGNQIALILIGETNRRIIVYNQSDAITRYLWGDVIASAPTPTPNIINRYGMRFDAPTGVLSGWKDNVNTSRVTVEDASDALATEISIGASAGSQNLFGHASNLRIYHKALSDQAMANA